MNPHLNMIVYFQRHGQVLFLVVKNTEVKKKISDSLKIEVRWKRKIKHLLGNKDIKSL